MSRPQPPEWVRDELVAWQEQIGFKPTLSNVFWDALCARANVVENGATTTITLVVPKGDT